ncbi:uncharacterized protein LOC9655240 [Selaginella moellendorffii]|nr:uncharacterized protein LOC9655240 [Selaginella moellendorffii]|eukprot:XP_002963711.2 uncharacterized protein LOC9655240 [Selaginella moellendorffii]
MEASAARGEAPNLAMAGMRSPGGLRAVSRPLVDRAPIVVRRNSFRGATAFVSTIGVLLVSKLFFRWAWQSLQVAAFCHSAMTLLGRKFRGHPPQEAFLGYVATPVTTLTISRPLIQWIFPDLYRTARFWRRLLPIYTRYMITKLNARNKSRDERDKLWDRRHEWGGKMVHQLVLDMSGFYVKSAQILASKAEFVPGQWRKWLSKHLDDAPPTPFSRVKKSIEKELALCPKGKDIVTPLDALFSNVEEDPIAAASIAQVHGATLIDGTPVVVKVQHLGMDTIMHSDLRNLARVARFLKGQLPVDLTPIVKEIQATIPLEFNFEREVWFMLRIKSSLETHGFSRIVCPSPIENLCTQRLIVMERLHGTPFTHILHRNADESLQPRIPKLRDVVKNLIEAYGQMILIDGIFHADPHAGNLLLLTDGRLGLLDFGQSKVLGEESRKQFARMVISLASDDAVAAARVLCEMGIVFEDSSTPSKEVSVEVLVMMARMLFDTCYVEEATVSPMAENSILRKVPMRSFNQELWMVVRTILMLRGLLFSLEMDESAVAIWKPYADVVLS